MIKESRHYEVWFTGPDSSTIFVVDHPNRDSARRHKKTLTDLKRFGYKSEIKLVTIGQTFGGLTTKSYKAVR